MGEKVEIVLETERLRLTNWLPEQVNDLYALHGRSSVTRFLTADGNPETLEQARRRLAVWEKNFAQYRFGKLRVIRKSDDVFLGRAGFGLYQGLDEPEIGFALFEQYWGKGYAFEAACGLRDWFFNQTKRDYFIGLADVNNKASLRVLEGIGLNKTEIKHETDGALCQFHILTRQQWQEQQND